MNHPRTSHERALSEHFYEAIQDPGVAEWLAEVRNNILAGGFYSQDIVDGAFQKWERDKEVTLVDAFGFSMIWTHYLSGDIACCNVPVPSGPGPDKDIALNQSILDQLPKGFQATFSPQSGRGADSDGSFTFDKDIGLFRKFWNKDTDEERYEPWFFDSDSTIALEVGTTSVSKTLYHLRCRSGVARWPYGYRKIIVLAAHPSIQERIQEHMQAALKATKASQ